MRPALLALVACAVTACSSSRAPVITYVDAPTMILQDSNGAYPIYVVVVYRAGDSPVDILHYVYPSLNVDGDFRFGPPFPGNEALGFPLSVPADAIKGSFDYFLSLRTQSGDESNQVQESIVLQ